MKKTVIATLLAAASFAASAQLTMSGKVSQWADTTKVGSVSTNQLVTEPTSNFAVAAVESVAGLKVSAVVETSLRGNTIDGSSDTKMGDRQFTVGLSAKNWSLGMGRNVHSHFLAVTGNDAFGTLYGSVAGDIHNLRELRMSDAVYASLSAGRFTVSVDRSAQVAGTDSSAYALNVKLAKLGATVARFEQGKERSTVLGLKTKIMGTDVFYVHSDDQGRVKSKGNTLGLARKFGNITAKASVGRTNTDVSAYALGADYALSKRTEIGLALRNVDRKGTASDVQQVGLGLTHRF